MRVIPLISPVPSSVKSGVGRPAASVYAVCISSTATVRISGSITLHGLGPAASTEKTFPVTSVQVKRSAAPVIGLAPTSPVTFEVGTSVIPVFDRITKLPAFLRSTGVGPGPAAYPLPANAKSATAIFPTIRFFLLMRLSSADLARIFLRRFVLLSIEPLAKFSWRQDSDSGSGGYGLCHGLGC